MMAQFGEFPLVVVLSAYRLLKSIMNTAVDDGLIKRNPCRVDGAGQEHSPERPILTVSQAFALADAFTDRRYRLLILLAVFCSLRWGELAALPRYCVDIDAGVISVRSSVVELARGPLITGPTKSAAGNRDVTVPPFLLPDVITHLEDFTAAAPRSLVFTDPQGHSYGGAISPASGRRPPMRRACPASTSTTTAIPATRWPVKRARPSAN
jgi:integrase